MRKIPKFKNVQDEMKFWDKHDDWTPYFDMAKPIAVKVELEKEKGEILILRLQKSLKKHMAQIAQEMGVGVSTLARMWLVEKSLTVK